MEVEEAVAVVTRIMGPMRHVEADIPYSLKRRDEAAAVAAKAAVRPPAYAAPAPMPEAE